MTLTGPGRRIVETAAATVHDYAEIFLAGACEIVVRDGFGVVVSLASLVTAGDRHANPRVKRGTRPRSQ